MMSGAPKVKSFFTELGLYLLFKKPLLYSFSDISVQSTLIWIGKAIKVPTPASSALLLAFEIKDCSKEILDSKGTLFCSSQKWSMRVL
jgi:hypothetical protein